MTTPDIAGTINGFFDGGLPVRLSAFDGSEAGDLGSPYGLACVGHDALDRLAAAHRFDER